MSKYNYFNVLTVDGYDFPSTPQINLKFSAQAISFLNRGDYIIEYSFNGVDLHGDMDPSDASNGLVFDSRQESKVFFRAVDGYGDVRVEAWGGWGRC